MSLSRRNKLLVALFAIMISICSRSAAASPSAGSESSAAPVAPRPAPEVAAESAVVFDPQSGQVLYEKDADRPRPIASTTKILTAIVVLEKARLDDVVTVSEHASRTEGSRVYLDVGERQTVRDLLYALLLESANDAAVALAEHVAGSEEAFAALMNQKARAIGARRSNFRNPHGLPAAGHYSTARDLALITAYAMKNRVFAAMVATKEYRIPWPAKDDWRVLHNHNRLLYGDKMFNGVKTGFTAEAGSCLVASAVRDGHTMIAVLLKDTPNGVYRDAAALLDYSFNEFQPRKLAAGGEQLGTLPVKGGVPVTVVSESDLYYTMPKMSGAAISREIKPLFPLEAPVEAGTRVGEALFLVGGQPVAKVGLIAANSILPLSQPKTPPYWVIFLSSCTIWILWRVIARRGKRMRRKYRRYSYRHLDFTPSHLTATVALGRPHRANSVKRVSGPDHERPR